MISSVFTGVNAGMFCYAFAACRALPLRRARVRAALRAIFLRSDAG